MTGSQRILAVAYGGGHLPMVLPVLRELRRLAPAVHIDLLALTTARSMAEEFASQAFGYAEILDWWPDPAALGHGERLLAGNDHPEVERRESVAYLGLNWIDLERLHGREAALALYRANGRLAFYPLQVMERLLERLRPDFVLATNAPRSEQAALHAAVRLGIPTLAMFDLFPLDDDPYARRPVLADHTAVLAPRAKETLLRAGLAEEAVIVTGNPAFDDLGNAAHRDAADRWRQRLGWEGKWVILYAGHAEAVSCGRWSDGIQFPMAIEQSLREYVARNPDTALLIRQHPSDWPQFKPHWDCLPAHPRIHVSLPPQESLEPLLLCADVVVVQGSTVGLQAAMAGKPVLSLEESPNVDHWGFSWARQGVASGVDRLEDLDAALQAARVNSRPVALDIPSPAAPRVAAHILKVLDRPFR